MIREYPTRSLQTILTLRLPTMTSGVDCKSCAKCDRCERREKCERSSEGYAVGRSFRRATLASSREPPCAFSRTPPGLYVYGGRETCLRNKISLT
eukprot:1395024-Amorphochlora_amoeboformis.AAC.1